MVNVGRDGDRKKQQTPTTNKAKKLRKPMKNTWWSFKVTMIIMYKSSMKMME